MYGIADLKDSIQIQGAVECPVLECKTQVPRMIRGGANLNSKKSALTEYFCQKHKIYISPTTFEYASELDNILWRGKSDLLLWEKIKSVKRESRVARENSEDALSWNVFRYLETSGNMGLYLQSITQEPQTNCTPVYWSYDSETGSTWAPLYSAREEFGELQARSSEPDIIVHTESTVFFIEAKFGASNKTPGSPTEVQKKIANPKKYQTGANSWYNTVFKSTYETVLSDYKYELLRFWLLGSWLASQLNKKFVLCNLVLDKSEPNIIDDFGRHIKQGSNNRFVRNTWENIYLLIHNQRRADSAADKMLTYFRNKSLGYKAGEKSKARIIRAFSI